MAGPRGSLQRQISMILDPSIIQRLRFTLRPLRTFPQSFAMHLPTEGYDIRTVQELLRHSEVKTAMSYAHVFNRGPGGVPSPVHGL